MIDLKLGDLAESLIEKTIPKRVVEYIRDKEGGCGCGKRKDFLNNLTKQKA